MFIVNHVRPVGLSQPVLFYFILSDRVTFFGETYIFGLALFQVIEGVAFAQRGASGSDNFEEPKDADGRKAKAADSKNSTVVPANDWAAVQCQTSVNWAPGSWFWNHFSGGLNHQVRCNLLVCHHSVHVERLALTTPVNAL